MSLSASLIGSIAMFVSAAVFQGATTEVEGCEYVKFQGTWRIVSVECGGKKDDQDIDKYTIKFDGNTMIVRECDGEGDGEGGGDEAAVKFKLREGRFSRRITFGGISGVYDFKDDNLRIRYSLDGDEPMGLRTTMERRDEVLMILKRIGQK